jgi:hypothetical protein
MSGNSVSAARATIVRLASQHGGIGRSLPHDQLPAEFGFLEVFRHALQAEINVAGRDIGQVSVGQSGRIKFEAFPFQKSDRVPSV